MRAEGLLCPSDNSPCNCSDSDTPFAATVLATAAPLSRRKTVATTPCCEMHQAFRKGDRKRLESLLPAARGHALDPGRSLGAELRLGEASPAEIRPFEALRRHYQEGPPAQRLAAAAGPAPRLVAPVAEQHPATACRTTAEVRCYALLIDQIKRHCPSHGADECVATGIAQRDSDDGCTMHGGEAVADKRNQAVGRLAQGAPGGGSQPRAPRQRVESSA